ncbi:MAG: ATP-binding protein [Methylococcales bacterium]
MNKVTLTIISNLENARLAGLCAREVAYQAFDETSVAEIELATVEAVNNCIEHACAGSDKHQISIKFWLTEDRLSIQMIDEGKAMIDSEWLDNLNGDFDFDDTDFENLPEGGMGLKIIKNCMDEVSYQQLDEHNRWLLIKYRPVAE